MRCHLILLFLVSSFIYSDPIDLLELKKREFNTEVLKIETALEKGSNYNRYIASYYSEGFKIYGLLTIPIEEEGKKELPGVIFIHGYIPPKQYSTTGSYVAYQAKLASSGFITFKPDLRGHGNSKGEAVSAHFSQKYVIDTLYALSALEKFSAIDKERIFYWGHSNGGEIGLRVVVLTNRFKAASFWAGVVGSYEDMLETYNYKIPFLRKPRTALIVERGLPSKNPDFWGKIDPFSYLDEIETPIIIHHGTLDKSVPIELSNSLYRELIKLNKEAVYYKYSGDNHNLSKSYKLAFERDILFFNR